ncbi:MAG: CheR family methyltransferase [Hyphomicrobiaceae bacterium]
MVNKSKSDSGVISAEIARRNDVRLNLPKPASRNGMLKDTPALPTANGFCPETLADKRVYHPSIPFSDEQFNFFRDLAYRRTGIAISGVKKSMVLRRIRKRMQEIGISSVHDYCNFLNGPHGNREMQPLINALTTNKTSFFREGHHFEHLRKIGLPESLARQENLGHGKLRIWSAGCSTGEEAWSIAMVARDVLGPSADSKIQILATDIDTDVLATANNGVYNRAIFEAVPTYLRGDYVRPIRGSYGECEVERSLRRLVTFKKLNLHDRWPFSKPFDIIFCRNVVIYFDTPTQRVLYNKFANALSQDSFLYCGHSELLHGLSDRFLPIGRSIYRRVV